MNAIIRVIPAGQTLSSGIKARPKPALAGDAASAFSEDQVLARLEEAGATLLALPAHGYSTSMRQMRFDIVHTALEAYGWDVSVMRPPAPTAAAISAMDEAFEWLGLIPEQSYLLRRILGARALVHPLTGRHLFPWRRLATLLGADHKSVQRWHRHGLKLISAALSKR
jgi:hypothetical protein